METGTPYVLFKDACNRKSNQQNLGTIRSSNLCTEILEYTSPDEVSEWAADEGRRQSEGRESEGGTEVWGSQVVDLGQGRIEAMVLTGPSSVCVRGRWRCATWRPSTSALWCSRRTASRPGDRQQHPRDSL